MNRLRDEWGDDPVAVRGIEILRGTAPTPRMPEMKRRVWLAQQQRETEGASGFRLSRLRVGVVVAGAILCVAGTSGAVIAARRWIVPALREVSRPAPKVASRTGSAQRPARPEKARPARLAAVMNGESVPGAAASAIPGEALGETLGRSDGLVAAGSATRPGPTQAVRQKASAPSRSSHVPAARRGATASSVTPGQDRPASPADAPQPAIAIARTASPMTPAAAHERTQVLDAMIALRRDHDPATAGAMLHQYLTSHPNGTLREEALVLAIEAAHARGDSALARSLAREYQDAYPNGRFRRYAQDQAAPGRS